jgi:NADPH:quinone reductase-like Zn-dependent oxidoreductase
VWLYNGQRNGRWMGTAVEYIALSADLVTELPDHVSFAEGATLGVPAMTAHRSVFVAGPVQALSEVPSSPVPITLHSPDARPQGVALFYDHLIALGLLGC